MPDIQVLQNEPVEVKQKAVPMGEATLAGHLPGKGAEEIASQSYVPKDPKDDKALAKAAELLHTAQADAPSPQTDAPAPKIQALEVPLAGALNYSKALQVIELRLVIAER